MWHLNLAGTLTRPLSMWQLKPYRMWACKSGMARALIAASSVSKGTHSYSSESVAVSVADAEGVPVPTVVPQAPPPSQADLERLYAFVNDRFLPPPLIWNFITPPGIEVRHIIELCNKEIHLIVYAHLFIPFTWLFVMMPLVEGQQKACGAYGCRRKHRVRYSRLQKVLLHSHFLVHHFWSHVDRTNCKYSHVKATLAFAYQKVVCNV